MSMKTFFLQFFTWWSGQTLGVRFFIWRHGKKVGEDEQGNIYYTAGPDADGYERRLVIYSKGQTEGSRIPPGWHGWMHHRTDTPPSQEEYRPREWQKPHQPNLTGGPLAYRPPGAMIGQEKRPQVTGDYDAWTPGA